MAKKAPQLEKQKLTMANKNIGIRNENLKTLKMGITDSV